MATDPMRAQCALCDEYSIAGGVLDRREAKEEPRGIFFVCPACVDDHDSVEASIAFAIREKAAAAAG